MPLLTRLQDPVEAHLLREALDAAGIAAQVRDEFAAVMAGGVSVWVAEEADVPAMPMYEVRVAMVMSAQPKSAALPAKQ